MAAHKRTSTRRQGKRFATKEEREKTQQVFLHAFKSTGNIRASCLMSGIDRSTVYQWGEHDETFALEYQQACLDVDDLIDAEIFRRAIHGENKPIVSMGKVVRDEQTGEVVMHAEKSDQLLIFLAKSRMDKYREKQHIDSTVKHSGSIDAGTLAIDPKTLTGEELRAMKDVLLQVVKREE